MDWILFRYVKVKLVKVLKEADALKYLMCCTFVKLHTTTQTHERIEHISHSIYFQELSSCRESYRVGYSLWEAKAVAVTRFIEDISVSSCGKQK